MPSPLPGYAVTTPYGTSGHWLAGYHTGDDYSTHGRVGVPVLATHGGYVRVAQNVDSGSYGLHVIVHGWLGRVAFVYAHLSLVDCSVSQRVRVGQVLGFSGTSGRSTGPHLHYEERVRPFGYWDHRRPLWNHR